MSLGWADAMMGGGVDVGLVDDQVQINRNSKPSFRERMCKHLVSKDAHERVVRKLKIQLRT